MSAQRQINNTSNKRIPCKYGAYILPNAFEYESITGIDQKGALESTGGKHLTIKSDNVTKLAAAVHTTTVQFNNSSRDHD